MKNGEIFEIEIKEKKDDLIEGLVEGHKVRVISKDPDMLKLGKSYFGFVYLNRKGELCASINIPAASLQSFGRAKVVDVDHSNGVFVSIGLPDKDVLISIDDLPDHPNDWPKEGDELIIKLSCDNKNRLWGKLAVDEDLIQGGFINYERKFKRNDTVSGIIYHLGKNGSFVLLDEGRFAYLHNTEIEESIHLGQKIFGRVIGFGSHDRINISLLKNAYARIDDDAQMILAAIRFTPNHKLAITDSSTPDEIKNQFGISKSSFKRAVGHLLKKQLIVKEDGYLKIKA